MLNLALAHCRGSGYSNTGVQAGSEPNTSPWQGSGYLSMGGGAEIDPSTVSFRTQWLLEHGSERRD